MATARDICTRALRRVRVLAAGEAPAAEDSAAALEMLNSMILRWPASGVEPFYTALTLSSTFFFFVPPAAADASVIDALSYQGTWDANANSPALATGTGTKGYFYKVATAGSTTLDSVTSWAVNDYAVFSGSVWLKSIDSTRLQQAVIDMLALELCDEFGREPTATLARNASMGWTTIQAAFIKSPTAEFDRAIRDTMVRDYDLQETMT